MSLSNLMLGFYPKPGQSELGGRRRLSAIAAAIAGLGEDGALVRDSAVRNGYVPAAGFTPSGVIPGRLRNGEPVFHTGLYLFEAGPSSLTQLSCSAAEFRDRLSYLPCCALAFIAGDRVVRGVLRGRSRKESSDKEIGDVAGEWTRITGFAAEALGLLRNEVDPRLGRVQTICLLAYDPEVRFNPDAEALPFREISVPA